ncbi:hypothetical protein G6F70_009004 [Rhizopus microsporus]|nr:hypothetical protein G6F71_008308 [Rhizopus microsporus]KAG1193837.1 hypothetical protein G6F70_009004 [Rhizopus microsporus]KAG1206239.1 hypothetical protein G6F69_008980 [Rhizopus microsporus]KAG1226471.1 hypothetical protein G6F67_008969 [Rhizopus microsporus]
MHTFAFIKYIFVNELVTNIEFDLNNFVNKDFFVEVFLSLVIRQMCDGSKSVKSTLKNTTTIYRQLIAKHKDSYCNNISYIQLKLPYAQQTALYECTKIQTAYQNNIKAHFSTRLRRILNKMFKKEERLSNLRERMTAKGSTEEAIKEVSRKEISNPCIQVKLDVASKNVLNAEVLDEESRSDIRALLSVYPDDYKFQRKALHAPENAPEIQKLD